jgi:hypothetical protein
VIHEVATQDTDANHSPFESVRISIWPYRDERNDTGSVRSIDVRLADVHENSLRLYPAKTSFSVAQSRGRWTAALNISSSRLSGSSQACSVPQ